jgi:hypothetical protein
MICFDDENGEKNANLFCEEGNGPRRNDYLKNITKGRFADIPKRISRPLTTTEL